jgi:hypothetical protein
MFTVGVPEEVPGVIPELHGRNSKKVVLRSSDGVPLEFSPRTSSGTPMYCETA